MKHRQRGLTLVELMVTLAAAIILLAVGLPFFGGVVANNRAVAEANGFLTSLRLARSEAVKRAGYVAVAPTSVSAGWEGGWTVYEESNRPGQGNYGTRQGGETALRTWPEVNATFPDPPAPDFIAFEPSGEASAAAVVELDSSGDSGARSHRVEVGLSGLIRMESYRP
jgi:type IV fimbrial biogenesis protein FimT